jgi:hypothetical protein
MRGSPEHFGKQCGARVILSTNGHIGSGYIAKKLTLEETQVAWRA